MMSDNGNYPVYTTWEDSILVLDAIENDQHIIDYVFYCLTFAYFRVFSLDNRRIFIMRQLGLSPNSTHAITLLLTLIFQEEK